MKYMNCQWSGHYQKCWEDGGGSADKAPAWWKTGKEKKNGQKRQKKEQAHVTITDASSDVSGSDSFNLLHNSYTFSIDWNNTLAPTTDLATPIFTTPYFFDLGANSHCSPHCEDFSNIKAIPTYTVRGINSSSVSATTSGTIHIKCSKGRRLTLKDALFIPDVKSALSLLDSYVTMVSEPPSLLGNVLYNMDLKLLHKDSGIARGSMH